MDAVAATGSAIKYKQQWEFRLAVINRLKPSGNFT
jgi:hypothetical protein